MAGESDVVQTSCCKKGPGYATPMEAMAGPMGTLLYVTCIYTGAGTEKPDYLATVDVDRSSATYSQVIHRLPMPYVGDELHHTGWNSCSSCHRDPLAERRRFLVLPCLLSWNKMVRSGRIYIVDTMKDPRAPKLHKIVEPQAILESTGCAYLHTSHCLASGDIMVSALGDVHGNARGSGFLLLDSDFNIKGRWEKPGHSPLFGHDFWYQPRHKTMISAAFGAPAAFTQGFKIEHVADGLYGRQLHVYDWPAGELKQILDLGDNGLVPIQLKFLHNPTKDIGFVGCALSGNVMRFYQKPDGTWYHEVSIGMKAIKVQNWVLPEMPSLVCDIVITLDDRFLYLANWFHGDVRQYDIRDPANPRLTGQAWVGGLIRKGSSVVAEAEYGSTYQLPAPQVQGHEIRGGPHMLQLSLDGKRLYVTNSLFCAWDSQFYPELVKKGGQMLQIEVNTEKGGLVINPNFLVDFGVEPDGPSLAHEMRYPDGDCTSDIWI